MSATVEEGTIIGQPMKRIEGDKKVTGATRYVDDLQLPGMLHGRLVTSIYAHAEINGIDASAALAVPGVVAVYTGKDVLPAGSEPADRNHHMLARDKALYYGQPVAVVVATSESIAVEAAGLVEVDYTPLEAVVDPLRAMERDAPVVRKKATDGSEWAEGQMHATVSGGDDLDISKLPDNITNAASFSRGDVAAGFKAADQIVERRYTTNWVHQSYIEPHGSVVVPDPLGNLTIYTTTQGQFYTRNATAEILGLPQNQVKVVGMEVGGGFGGKAVMLEPLAGWIALRHKLPVKINMTRSEELSAGNPAPGSVIDIKIGGKQDGTITAIQARLVFDSGCYPGTPVTVAALMSGGYYRTDNLELVGYEVLTNKPGNGAYRAPGAPQATFAIEQAVDELAGKVGWDPVEFRLHNCSVEGDPQPNGVPWPRIGLKEILEVVRDHPAYKNRAAGPHKGVGVAIGGWPGGVEPCAANIRVNTDGSLVVQLGSTDITGTNTVMSQLAAEAFGTTPDNVTIESADTGAAPYAGMSGGSKVTYTVGPAVIRAAQAAREQVLAIAAAEMEVSPDDLELARGKVTVKGAPDKEMSIAAIAGKSMTFGGKYEPVYGIGKSAQTDRAPGFSGQIADVSIDPDTGAVTIDRYVTVQDVGKALNPAQVEGQMIGGTVQSIGFAMYEAIQYGEDGQLLSSTLMDYVIPKSFQVPPIETVIVEVPARSGPYGAKGIGEPPIIPGPAALANAIAAATGSRVLEAPFTPERVRKAVSNGA
ncbi:MAG TPA: xanthine dehydrogenase family protein molybdopterin-binding subunit [Thermomicrobiales bacterium]|nr:xanthine dehydrogenase family protein molybdopterin-binding subunit [Thermomicrobiales bacterium]